MRIQINRAPVLTLWATVVAERLGFDHDEALTLGRAVAGLSAYAKGKSLGLFEPSKDDLKRKRAENPKEAFEIALLGRAIPVVITPDGIRALSKGKPDSAAVVEKYLKSKFGEHLEAAEKAMIDLAKSRSEADLAVIGFKLYEHFRPAVPKGESGWGAKGELDLSRIKSATV